jgi:glycopeptide antibiotics resistance protein
VPNSAQFDNFIRYLAIMKKLAVLFPVCVLALFYFWARYRHEYAVAGLRGNVSLAIGVLLMLIVMIVAVMRRRQEKFTDWLVQSSFLVYVFMVLTLTGYFILFREVAAHGWWQRELHRIHEKERINLHPFLMFKQFRLWSLQVVGNAVMLLPLGIYIPLLFRRADKFFKVFFICLLVSISIELMQLITSYRSTDIDDVILNTTGAVAGFIFYRIVLRAYPRQKQ